MVNGKIFKAGIESCEVRPGLRPRMEGETAVCVCVCVLIFMCVCVHAHVFMLWG